MNEIVLGSKLAMTDGGQGLPVFFCKTTTGKQFWSNEQLSAGTLVSLVEKKAGDKYVKDGEELTVAKDGFNLEVVIGQASAILANIRAAKEMQTELQAI